MANEQPLSVEVNGHYHAVLVPSDIENVEVMASHRNHVHAVESSLQFFDIANESNTRLHCWLVMTSTSLLDKPRNGGRALPV